MPRRADERDETSALACLVQPRVRRRLDREGRPDIVKAARKHAVAVDERERSIHRAPVPAVGPARQARPRSRPGARSHPAGGQHQPVAPAPPAPPRSTRAAVRHRTTSMPGPHSAGHASWRRSRGKEHDLRGAPDGRPRPPSRGAPGEREAPHRERARWKWRPSIRINPSTTATAAGTRRPQYHGTIATTRPSSGSIASSWAQASAPRKYTTPRTVSPSD